MLLPENWRLSVALLKPSCESLSALCQADMHSCCSKCLLANGKKKRMQYTDFEVVLWDAQGETAVVDSGQAQDAQYEDVPYVLIYATVRSICQYS